MLTFVDVRTTAAYDEHRVRPRRLPKLRWFFLLGLALLVVIVAAVLPSLVHRQTRKLLDGLSGVAAEFSDARMSLIPLSYRISHLKIREKPPKTKEPAFYGDELAVKLRWDRVLTGRLVGSVEARKFKLVLHQGVQQRLPPIEKIVPFRAELEQARLQQGEVLYVWTQKEGQPSLWFHRIEATIESAASRPGMTDSPLRLSARGKVQRSGTMTVSVVTDAYATPFNFSAKATLSGFDPSEMNGLLSADRGIKLSPGRFDLEMSFECRSGRLRGWINPHLEGGEISAADHDLGSALKAALGKISMSFASPTAGTEPSGRIAVEDDLRNPKLQLWPSIEKSIENGLLLGLEEAIKRNTGPGKKEVDRPPEKPSELKIER